MDGVFLSVQIAFCSQKSAVFEDIPDFQVVVTAWAGVKHFGNRFPSPGPEGGGDHIIRQGQVDVDPWCSISPHSRCSALHDPLVFAHGVVEAVEHPAGFVQIADEDVITVRIVKPPDFRLGQLRLVKLAPVAGGGGQGTDRAIREVVLIVPAHVCDGIVSSIVAANYITRLGDVLRTILWDINASVCVFIEQRGRSLAGGRN